MRRRIWGTAVVVLVAASAFAYKIWSQPEVTIGPTPYPVAFISRHDLVRKPLIDVKVFGRDIVFPAPALPLDPFSGPPDVSEDWAGVLYIEKEWDGFEVWEIDGTQVDCWADTTENGIVIKVPYAPAPERRVATFKLNDSESIEVRLPFREDKVPSQPKPITMQVGPFRMIADPGPRPFRGMDLNYTFKFEGPVRNILLTCEQEMVGSGISGQGASRFSTAGSTQEHIARGYVHKLKYKLHVINQETMRVRVKRGKGGVTRILGPNGKELLTFKDNKSFLHGYPGLLFGEEFFYMPVSLRFFPADKFESKEATLLKPVATYEFELNIDNSGP